MKYQEIFTTVEQVTNGCVEVGEGCATVYVELDEEDDTIELTINSQWFDRADLLELAGLLLRIAATLPPEVEE
jgi:hypothetical protein